MELEKGDTISLEIKSDKVIREEVDSYREALEFVEQFDSVSSFSFRDGVVEVMQDE